MYRRHLQHSRVKNLFKFASVRMGIVLTLESSLEFDTCFQLEYSPAVKTYISQPEGFYYEFEGKSYPYTPDFLVKDQNDQEFLLEVKPSSQIDDIDFLQRFPAKQKKAKELASPLILITEKQIRSTPLLDNLKLVHRYAGFHSIMPSCNEIMELLREQKEVAIFNLCESIDIPQGEMYSSILLLLSRGLISGNLMESEFGLVTLLKCAQQNSLFIYSFPFEDEFTLYQENEVKMSTDENSDMILPATLDCYSEILKEESVRRLNYIQWVEKRIIGGWTEKNITPLINEAAQTLRPPAPHWRQLVRWYKKYLQHRRQITALVPNHKNKGNKTQRVSSREEIFIENAILKFQSKERPSISSMYCFYCDSVRIFNLSNSTERIKTVSLNTFYRRIKKLSVYQVMNARDGRVAANMEFQAIDSFLPTSRVLERVEIDHTPLDLILLDDELLLPLGRPSLTLLIDVYSHCAVGFNLCFTQPGYESVRCALLHSLVRKDYVQEQYPCIENSWISYGKPETLVVDNGAEFWSGSLEHACLELGINTQYNPVRKPWLKPLIERMFGTINRKFLESIPGKTFSNILDKADYNPQKDAVMRFSVFLEIFHHWLLDVYHYEPDSRYRYVPALAWKYGCKVYPPATIEKNELKKLEIILSISIRRLHRRGGIHLHHLRYDSKELSALRMQYSLEEKGKKKVLVKLNPADMSYIYVYIDELKSYIRVPCVDPCKYTQNLSLQQHLINLRFHRDFINENINLDSLSKARIYISERIQGEIDNVRQYAKRSSKKGMKKIASHQGVTSQNKKTIASDTIHFPAQKGKNRDTHTLPDDWDDFTSDLEPF